MADNVSITSEQLTNLTSQLGAFTKAIEKSNAKLLRGKNTVDEMGELTKECNKLAEKQEKQYRKNSDVLKETNGLWGDTKKLVSGITGQLGDMVSFIFKGGLIAGVAQLVSDSVKLDNTTTKLAAQLGNVAGVTKKELVGAVNELQAELGASYKDAVDVVEALGNKRYTENINEAAKGINLFSRATGVSQENMAQLSTELNKGAGMSTKSINSMYAGMMEVQKSMGLSKEGMTAVTSQIQKAATNMAAFGKKTDGIKKMAVQTIALVSAMEKVGIAAGNAVELVDRLTDPDRIEDNTLLYSQLGISMEDAMSGNIDLSNMDNQLKEISQKIVDMGPIAGAQFAKQMGMSYKEASKMAKMEGGEVNKVADAAQTSEDKALETMKKIEEATEGIGEKAQSALNKAEGKLRQLPKWLLAVGALALMGVKKLVKKAWENFKDILSDEKEYSAITEGVGSSIAQGLEKGGKIIASKATGLFGGLFGLAKETIGNAFAFGEDKMNVLYNKAMKKDFASAFYASAKDRANEMAEQAQEATNRTIESLKKKQQELMDQLQSTGANKDVVMNDGGGLNAAAGKEDDKNIQAIVKAYNALNNELKDQLKIQEFQTAEEAKRKGFTSETYDAYKKCTEVIKQNESAEANIKSLQEERNKLADEMSALEDKVNKSSGETKTILLLQLKAKKEELKKNKENLAEIVTGKKENAEIYGEYGLQQQALKKINELQTKSNKQGAIKKNLEQEANKNLDDQIKKHTKLGKIMAGFGQGIKNKAKEKFNNSTFGQAYNKAKESGKGKGAAIRAGAGSVVAKGLGNITKMLGPMAIVMAVLGKVIDKVKEPLEEILDQAVECLQPIVDVLLQILGPALRTIITALLPPLLRATAVVIKILGFILKPIIAILRLLSKAAIFGSAGKAMAAVADTLEAVTGDQMTGALNAAADKIENGGMDIKKAADKQEEIAEKEDSPEQIKSVGGEIVQTQAGSSNNANEQASSTTQTVTETSSSQVESENQKLEAQKEKKAQKQYRDHLQKFMETLLGPNLDGISGNGLLPQLVNAVNGLKTTNDYQSAQKDTIRGLD